MDAFRSWFETVNTPLEKDTDFDIKQSSEKISNNMISSVERRCIDRDDYMEKEDYDKMLNEYESLVLTPKQNIHECSSLYNSYGSIYYVKRDNGIEMTIYTSHYYFDKFDKFGNNKMFIDNELISELDLEGLFEGDNGYVSHNACELVWIELSRLNNKLDYIRKLKEDIIYYSDKLVISEKFDNKEYYKDVYDIING